MSKTAPALDGPMDTNSHQVRWSKGADVASATALTLGADGNYFDITGTTTITSIGALGVGTVVLLQFDAALTLTHHATDLILPGGANITTAAGDHAILVEYATGDWRCVGYIPAGMVPLTGIATLAQIIAGTASKAIDAAIVASMVGENALTSATSITVDMANKLVQTVTLAHNATFANPTNVPVGHVVYFIITQDGTGSRTGAWGSYYKFAGGTAPTLTTTASKADLVAFHCKSTTQLVCLGSLLEFTL